MRTVGRRTRWLLAAVLVLLVAGAGVTIVVVRDRSPDAAASSCDLPDSTPDARSAPASFAPGGGGVQPVEAGWSPTADGRGMLLAAVVQNTSRDQVAYRTRVTFTPAAKDWFLEIPVILPGQRIGVATSLEGSAGLSTPQVLVGQTHWLDAKSDGRRFRAVTTTVRADADAARVSVTSPYCRDVARHGVALLFRDAAGRLLGGTRVADYRDGVCRPGVGTGTSPVVPGVPAEADPGRTEAYAYCDPAAVESAPAGAVGENYRYA